MDTKKRGIRGFQVLDDECIWMKAGVVALKLCNRVYDCFDCSFDKAMTKAKGKLSPQEAVSNWASYYKEKYDGADRPCRHVVTGRIEPPKICTHNYECHNCAFDQMLDEIEMSEAQSGPEYKVAAGFELAVDYYYSSNHIWIRIEHGGMARIGFDDFLMKLFGKAEFIPEKMGIGSDMEKGKQGWSITQDNHKASLLAPISGTVLSVNQRVKDDPGIMHDDPYQEGWLFVVEPVAPAKYLRKLKFGEDGIAWMNNESAKLMDLMGPEYSNLAATGGEPIKDFFGFNPEIGWEKLVKTFLKA